MNNLDLSKANIDSLVTDINKNNNLIITDELLAKVILINEFIIKSNNIDYSTIYKYYQTNNRLYSGGYLHELYFYEYRNKFSLEQLKNDISSCIHMIHGHIKREINHT